MQTSMPFADKLDEPLAELCNGRVIGPSSRVPVVIRCAEGSLDEVAEHVKELGGLVRHRIPFVDAIGAWLFLHTIERLAQNKAVRALELEQKFTVA
jgi:hypothetical protein